MQFFSYLASSAAPPQPQPWELVKDEEDGVYGNLVDQQVRLMPPNRGPGTDKPFTTVLSRSSGAGAIDIVASRDPIDCGVWSTVRTEDENTLRVRLTDMPRDGVKRWHVDKVHWTIWSARRKELDATVVSVAHDEGGKTKLELEFALGGTSLDDPWIHFDGPLEATACAPQKVSSEVQPRPQNQLTLTVGDVAVPVLGARVVGSGDDASLQLSSHPLSCQNGVPGSIRIQFSKKSFGVVGEWVGLFGGTPKTGWELGQPTGATRPYTVRSSFALLGGETVSLQGTGVALNCQ